MVAIADLFGRAGKNWLRRSFYLSSFCAFQHLLDVICLVEKAAADLGEFYQPLYAQALKCIRRYV